MDLNEGGSFLPSESEDTVCDWKNIDMYLEPRQLVIGVLTRSFIFRSPTCSFDHGKWQSPCALGSPFVKHG